MASPDLSPEQRGHQSATEIPVLSDGILARVDDYIISEELREQMPSPDYASIKDRESYRQVKPGCDFALTSFEGRLVIVPAWHPLNRTGRVSHGDQYASGGFEGGSLEPVEENGEIVAANLINWKPKAARLYERTLQNRDIHIPFDEAELTQGIGDLLTLEGKKLLLHRQAQADGSEDVLISRAYVRPTVIPDSRGPLGIRLKPSNEIYVTTIAFNWPFYFPDPERVYHGQGLEGAVLLEQRFGRPKGKNADLYGPVGGIADAVKEVGADEIIFLSPYLLEQDGSRTYVNLKEDPQFRDRVRLLEAIRKAAWGDGGGEEYFAISDQGELWYPPENVGRLGGTTLDYIVNYMAPSLGIKTVEQPVSLELVKAQKVRSVAFAGNAARVAPIGKVNFYDHDRQLLDSTGQMEIHPLLRQIVDQYEREVRGKVEHPSDPSLWSRIEYSQEALEARRKLYEAYKDYFEPGYIDQVLAAA